LSSAVRRFGCLFPRPSTLPGPVHAMGFALGHRPRTGWPEPDFGPLQDSEVARSRRRRPTLVGVRPPRSPGFCGDEVLYIRVEVVGKPPGKLVPVASYLIWA